MYEVEGVCSTLMKPKNKNKMTNNSRDFYIVLHTIKIGRDI